ncbi:hypothetical protein [Helicobacter canis]|nr:hypothetical protein [Helicobacter canis]
MDSRDLAWCCMDCHALLGKARNDGVGALYEKVDSRLDFRVWNKE